MLKEVFVGTQGQQKALACGDIAMDVLEGLFERHELQKPDADLAMFGWWKWRTNNINVLPCSILT